MAHTCEECGATFPKLSGLLQHRKIENHWKKFTCDICAKVFNRRDNLDRHMKKHQENTLHCDECGKCFSRPDNLLRHQRESHQIGGGNKRPAENEDQPIKRLKPDADPRQYYTINKIKEERIQKFKTTNSVYKINIKDIEVTEYKDVLTTIKRLFVAIFEDLTEGAIFSHPI